MSNQRHSGARPSPVPRAQPSRLPLRLAIMSFWWRAAVAAALALSGFAPALAACTPAGGLPGSPRAASPVGSVLAGLGVLGPISRLDAALAEAAIGRAPAATPDCARSAQAVAQPEPASLPAAAPDRSAGNPFDVVTGGKHEQRIDVALPGVDSATAIDHRGQSTGALERLAFDSALTFQFSRFYSSGNTFSLSLGPGWSHSFDTRMARRRLSAPPAAGLPAAELQLLQADGRRIAMQPVAQITPSRVRYQGSDLTDGVIEEDLAAADHPWIWRWPSGRRLAFDAKGRLAEVVAPDLDRLVLRYDASGWLAAVEDRHGRAIRLVHESGRLTELRLPDGQSIRYAYDAERRLVGVRYPDGRLVQHHYEDGVRPERLTGTTEPDGRRSRFRYAPDGRVVSSASDSNDARNEVRATYRLDHTTGHSGETVLEFQGQATRYRWRLESSGVGLIVSAEGAGCPVCPEVGQRLARDGQGRPVAWGEWRLGYDRQGRIVSLSRGAAASDPVWRFSYASADPLAQPSGLDAPSVVPAQRRQLQFAHNTRGQLTLLIERGWAPYSDGIRPVSRGVRIVHSESGVLAGKPLAVEQIEVGDRASAGVTDPSLKVSDPVVLARTEFRFDSLRRLEAILYPEGIVHSVIRDALGRASRESLVDGSVIARSFDAGWQLSRLERGGQAITWLRDRTGQLQSIDWGAGEPLRIERSPTELMLSQGERSARIPIAAVAPQMPGSSLATPPAALPMGLVVAAPASLTQVDADGNRTETVFDDLGRIIEERSAQRGLRQVFHDTRGHPVRLVLPAGGVERRRFDAAGRMVERDQQTPGARVSTRLHWDGMRLVGIEHPEQTTRATIDSGGRLTALEHRLAARTIRYDFRYDKAFRISERSLGDGLSLRFEVDAAGRPRRLGLVWPGSAEPIWLVAETVYQAGLPVAERLGEGVRLTRRFDGQGRLEALDWVHERRGDSLARFELRRRDDGLLDSIRRHDGEERYGFDAVGRLIVREWRRSGGDKPLLRSFLHYSPGGDLKLLRDEAGRTERVAAPEADAAGRPLMHGRWQLQYGASGRIEQVERAQTDGVAAALSAAPVSARTSELAVAARAPVPQRVRYRYNALGERVFRSAEHPAAEPAVTRFLYHQNALVAELDRDERIVRHFIRWQGRVIAIVEPAADQGGAPRPPTIVWLLSDHLGTPQVAVDRTGRPVWRGRLGVYGELLEEHGDFHQPLRFSGQYHDRDTGLIDNYQRTYDARRGRYLEPDPLGLAAGWNLYAYVSGNPVQATDPLGLILFAFDGTGNGNPARAPDTLSNVAKFFSLYAGADRHYMSGVGAFDAGSGIGADSLDTLQASSARRRVDHMLGVLDSALRAPETRSAPVNIDVIGFSRGAAMARDFANTVATRIRSGHYLGMQRCVTLNFVGLWDTVAQFGLNGQANPQWSLGIPPQARVVVHAVALNEHRRFFPLESIGPAAAAPADGWRLERGFIGDHGDIGGSHAQGDLSDVALGWMVEQAHKAGVGLKALDAAWQTVTEPLLHDARTLLAPGPDREFRLPSNALRGAATSGQPGGELGSGLDRARAETMIRRYPYMLRGHDGAATLAGRVDMAAYSAWLSEQYGLKVQY
ncbi:MAG: hypothetical protein FJY25_13100 [Betaproteobacteria bacterium]|nr:hypothetical protein [Betaproteobacteria bacterium]